MCERGKGSALPRRCPALQQCRDRERDHRQLQATVSVHQAYLDAIDALTLDKDAVRYDEKGNAIVDFQN